MKILNCSLLVFCFIAAGFAQEKIIDKAEFDAMSAEGNSYKIKWKDEKYRMTITTSSKTIGRPQTDYSSKMILEFGPSMESRFVTTSVFGPNPASRWESLRIGDWVYTRSGSNPWARKEYAAPAPGKESEESPYNVLSSQAEYRYLGQGMLRDTPVQIFVKTERQTRVNKKSGDKTESDTKVTCWIDAKGVFRRHEFTSESRGKFTSQTSINMEWELDPSITFTAPEILP